jgi:hypothetical protein
MLCKSRFLSLLRHSALFLFSILFVQSLAHAATGVEGGFSSEYLSVSATTEDGEKRFTIGRPIGLALGLDFADMGEAFHPVVAAQLQVPGSFARLESTKWQLGGRYYLSLPKLSRPDETSPFTFQTRSSSFYFLQFMIAYQRLFYAFLDKDGQPFSFDRAAAGLSFGVGGDFFPSWLSGVQSEWRFADDNRLRFRAVADISVSVLSFGFYSTSLQSASLRLMLFKPL